MAINLSKPQVGSNINVTPLAGEVIFFDFSTSNVALSQVGDNFVLTFEDGATITLLNFYNVYSSENMPSFNVQGVPIDGEKFFTALEATELMPAAGPSQYEDGAFYNAPAAGDLASGVDSLDGVDSSQTLSRQNTFTTFDSSDFEATATVSTPLTSPTVSENLFIGTSGNDVLSGTSGNDVMYGRAGNDEMYGRAGSDVLYGEQGADVLNGGDNRDSIFFDAEDTLLGGSGLDIAVGTKADILDQLGSATDVELFVNVFGTPLQSTMNSDILTELNISYDATNGRFTLEKGEWDMGAEDANGFTNYIHQNYEIWIKTNGVGTSVSLRTFNFTAHDADSPLYPDMNTADTQPDGFVVELTSVNSNSGMDQTQADAIEEAMSGLSYIDMTSSVFLINNGMSYDATQNTLELSDSWQSEASLWHNIDTGLILDDVENEVNVIIKGGA